MFTHFPLRTDSYKLTHWKQYPPNTTEVYSYLESRGGLFPATVFFGLQYYLYKYLEGSVVGRLAVEKSAELARQHLGSDHFNYDGWMHIVNKYQGRLPVEIKAVAEGTVVPTGNVLVTIRNTDPQCYWLPNFLETLLLKVWYPITVASQSYHLRKELEYWLVRSGGTPAQADFMLHDFGYRGVSSEESAAIGGAAHLTSFLGSDTLIANMLLSNYYDADPISGFSVPATEHSTITAWGREGELAAYRNVFEQYPNDIVSIVSDSFDIYAACRMYGDELRELIEKRDKPFVVRPDSGDPLEVIFKVLNILEEKFGATENSQGKRVLNHVRILWGDGINSDTIHKILTATFAWNFAAENFAFGMGGALLQKCDRDTQKFAFKCSSITVDGQEREVFKDPITDPGKKSKRGKLGLYDSPEGLVTLPERGDDGLLRTVFLNGEILNATNFSAVRERLKGWCMPGNAWYEVLRPDQLDTSAGDLPDSIKSV
jgi:nicotinamide phosphoribosyltransferase